MKLSEQDLTALEGAYRRTAQHLKRFSEGSAYGLGGRPRWSTYTLQQAELLLRAYFFGPDQEITTLEGQLPIQIVGEVRRRYAGICYLSPMVGALTVGKSQEWHKEHYEEAKAFHKARKRRHLAKKANRSDT